MSRPQAIFHEDFNFHDGNLLLAASGSRDGRSTSPVETVYFRLHESILAIYSTTFADMLSMPQAGSAIEQGVIQLQDPLDHVIKLLTAIYYGGSVPQEPLSRAKWDFLVPVLILTDKYGMGPLAKNLLPKLLEDWPTSLEKWDDVDARSRSIVRATADQRPMNPSSPFPDNLLPEPAMVVKFGQTHPEARNILPAAFYHLSRLSHPVPEELGLYDHDEPEDLRSADSSLLTSADWVRVARGQADMREWLYGCARRAIWVNSAPCPGHEYREIEEMYDLEDSDNGRTTPCERVRWWDTHVEPRILAIGTKRTVDVLAGLRDIRDAVKNRDRKFTLEGELCSSCQSILINRLDDSRRRFWAKLPSFFRLGDYPNWGKS